LPEIKPIDSDLWVVDDKFPLPKGLLPFSIPGFLGRCSIRMTLIRLGDQKILLHSPTAYSDELAEKIGNLGEIKYVVGPSIVHNSFLLDWHKAFPNSELLIAPKTPRRVPELKGYPFLNDENPISDQDLGQVLMQSHYTQETLFFHRKTKTLITTDFTYGINPQADLPERLWLLATGVRNPLGVTFYYRRLVKGPKALCQSLEKVMRWDFERIIMSHGTILEQGGKEAFKKVWGHQL